MNEQCHRATALRNRRPQILSDVLRQMKHFAACSTVCLLALFIPIHAFVIEKNLPRYDTHDHYLADVPAGHQHARRIGKKVSRGGAEERDGLEGLLEGGTRVDGFNDDIGDLDGGLDVNDVSDNVRMSDFGRLNGRHERLRELLRKNYLGEELNDVYQRLLERSRGPRTRSFSKGFKEEYRVNTKQLEDGSEEGFAEVAGGVVQQTYNGSEPVLKVAKVHASASKGRGDKAWKVQPLQEEYRVVTAAPGGDKQKKTELKKEEEVGRSGEDELEQLMIGDDYENEEFDAYLKNQLKNGKLVLNDENLKTSENSQERDKKQQVEKKLQNRKKRALGGKEVGKNKEKKEKKKEEEEEEENDVNLLKKYIALQDAENRSLMWALDLASEIEFEQDGEVGNKAKQGRLLEEQMRQMRKALSDEKILGEIKKAFARNLREKEKKNFQPGHNFFASNASDDVTAELPPILMQPSSPQSVERLQEGNGGEMERYRGEDGEMEKYKGGGREMERYRGGDREMERNREEDREMGRYREEDEEKLLKRQFDGYDGVSEGSFVAERNPRALERADEDMLDDYVMKKVRQYVKQGGHKEAGSSSSNSGSSSIGHSSIGSSIGHSSIGSSNGHSSIGRDIGRGRQESDDYYYDDGESDKEYESLEPAFGE